MNKIRRLLLLMQAVLGFALTPAPAQTPPPAEPTSAQPTPTPTLGDRFTQILPDRQVLFRFFAPKANAVDVVIGIKSGPYEIQGTTTTAMISWTCKTVHMGQCGTRRTTRPHLARTDGC